MLPGFHLFSCHHTPSFLFHGVRCPAAPTHPTHPTQPLLFYLARPRARTHITHHTSHTQVTGLVYGHHMAKITVFGSSTRLCDVWTTTLHPATNSGGRGNSISSGPGRIDVFQDDLLEDLDDLSEGGMFLGRGGGRGGGAGYNRRGRRGGGREGLHDGGSSSSSSSSGRTDADGMPGRGAVSWGVSWGASWKDAALFCSLLLLTAGNHWRTGMVGMRGNSGKGKGIGEGGEEEGGTCPSNGVMTTPIPSRHSYRSRRGGRRRNGEIGGNGNGGHRQGGSPSTSGGESPTTPPMGTPMMRSFMTPQTSRHTTPSFAH